MRPLDRIRARLAERECAPSSDQGDRFAAKCPAHEDTKASLSVRLGADGRVLLKCHAGCRVEEVVAALGMTMKDLFPPPSGSEFEQRDRQAARNGTAKRSGNAGPAVREIRYVIVEEPENLVEHVRREYADGSKRFVWERNRRRGLGGLSVDRLPLYGISDVREALRRAERGEPPLVILVEGEKAQEELKKRGFLAVGTVTGAGGTPGRDAMLTIAGCKVVVWADNDASGRDHMDNAATMFTLVCESLQDDLAPRENRAYVFEWPGAPDKGDAADFFAAGHTADELRELIAAARRFEPSPALRAKFMKAALASTRPTFRSIEDLEQVAAAHRDWICEGLLAPGAVTLLAGKPKGGKSTLSFALLAAIEQGATFLGLATSATTAIYISEESAGTLIQKAKQFGLKKALFLTRSDVYPRRPFAEIVAGAVAEARKVGAKTFVIDTVAVWAGLGPDGEKDAGSTQAMLEPVLQAAATGLAVLLVHHLRKQDGEEGDAIRGSNALAGGVDIVVEFRRDASGANRRAMSVVGRFQEPPPDRVLELTEIGYVLVGTKAEVSGEDLRRRVLGMLPTAPEGGKSLDEVRERVSAKRQAVKVCLESLSEPNGRVERLGAGSRGSPYRYRKRPCDSVPVPTPIGRTGTESAGTPSGRQNEAIGNSPEDSVPVPHLGTGNGNGNEDRGTCPTPGTGTSYATTDPEVVRQDGVSGTCCDLPLLGADEARRREPGDDTDEIEDGRA